MIINKVNGQLLSNEGSVFGVFLQTALAERNIERIDAGTVMVAKFSASVEYLFEVGFNLNVQKLREVSPMYPMKGSRLPLRRLPDGITESMVKSKTVLFRDCRLPTPSEYTTYLRAVTV